MTPNQQDQISRSPAEFLRGKFLERKKSNPQYSTRAFARDLGISQTLLSLVLNRKWHLTLKQAAQIAILLNLSQDDSQALLMCALNHLPENSKAVAKVKKAAAANNAGMTPINYDVERFKAICDWYHLAILDLTTTKGFKPDLAWIAKRLEISRLEARDAVERLLRLGLLEKQGRTYIKSKMQIYFGSQSSEAAIRQFHKQMITKGVAQFDKTTPEDFASRLIAGVTVTVPKAKIKEAKERLLRFQKEFSDFLSHEQGDEVYQLNMQFFSLTNQGPPNK